MSFLVSEIQPAVTVLGDSNFLRSFGTQLGPGTLQSGCFSTLERGLNTTEITDEILMRKNFRCYKIEVKPLNLLRLTCGSHITLSIIR